MHTGALGMEDRIIWFPFVVFDRFDKKPRASLRVVQTSVSCSREPPLFQSTLGRDVDVHMYEALPRGAFACRPRGRPSKLWSMREYGYGMSNTPCSRCGSRVELMLVLTRLRGFVRRRWIRRLSAVEQLDMLYAGMNDWITWMALWSIILELVRIQSRDDFCFDSKYCYHEPLIGRD